MSAVVTTARELAVRLVQQGHVVNGHVIHHPLALVIGTAVVAAGDLAELVHLRDQITYAIEREPDACPG